jgi:hypothetical protein
MYEISRSNHCLCFTLCILVAWHPVTAHWCMICLIRPFIFELQCFMLKVLHNVILMCNRTLACSAMSRPAVSFQIFELHYCRQAWYTKAQSRRDGILQGRDGHSADATGSAIRLYSSAPSGP